MAEISSVFGGFGGEAESTSATPAPQAITVNESAFVGVSAPNSDYLEEFTAKRSQVIEYTVREGDLLSFIASDFGVSTQSLVWANELKDANSIQPGQVLRIPPVSGVIHTVKSGDTASSIASLYGVETEEVIGYNRLPKDGSLDAGLEIVIPGGVIPSTTTAGRSVTPSSFGHLPNLDSYFLLPTSGFNWGRIHGRNGVDVANSCGTAVLAAASGTVTVADASGWNGGFGQYIKLSHENGTETLYAHASKLLVGAGEQVVQGQKIALMGTTGRSTGCHLHFEVHGAQNPLSKF